METNASYDVMYLRHLRYHDIIVYRDNAYHISHDIISNIITIAIRMNIMGLLDSCLFICTITYITCWQINCNVSPS